MFATWSRSFLLLASLGLVSACDEMMPPPDEKAPAAVAPAVAAPAAVAPTATAPAVKKKPKPVVIDFGEGGSGGGGWS